jgi:hypothetical protein
MRNSRQVYRRKTRRIRCGDIFYERIEGMKALNFEY